MRISLVIWLSIAVLSSYGQTKSELEDRRKKTLEEIDRVDNLIQETAKQKTSNLNDIRIIGNKLNLRENVITGLREEIELLEWRIELNRLAIDLMENDLGRIKKDYENTIINSYKAGKGFPELAYIFSAKDFNQGYKRIKYLQQAARFRRNQAETIAGLREEIKKTKENMESDLANISDLKTKEEGQKRMLMTEQDRKKRMVNTLTSREKQLRKELEEKKRIAQKIEAEIARLIEEERRKSSTSELTPEMKLISDNFEENRGRLPWPVEKGVVTSKFGSQKHPVLNATTEENIGIEITSAGTTPVRAVFKGQVVRVFAIQGANSSIIIKHGKYFSVYQNIVNVRVKKDDMVDARQMLGDVFCDTDNGNKSQLKFMIFMDRDKLDPEIWLAKK